MAYGRKKQPTRKYIKRKRVYRKKRTYAKKSAFSKTLQIANLRPSTIMVKFQAKQRYLVVSNDPTVPTNSIFNWNCSAGLKNPSIISGIWQAQRSGDLFNSQDYQQYFDRYNTYKVLGSKMSALITPNPIDGLGTQSANLVSMMRTPTASQLLSTTPLYEIESAFASKSRNFGQNSGTGFRMARINQGYSPKKQLNLKDIKDNDEIDVQTTAYGNNPAESTFINLVISPQISTASQGHMTCIVDVKFDVIAMFQDSKSNNAPLP